MRTDRVAACRTVETAWRLVAHLEAATSRWVPPVRFWVVLPEVDQIEVHPRPGSPLRPADRTAIAALVRTFREEG